MIDPLPGTTEADKAVRVLCCFVGCEAKAVAVFITADHMNLARPVCRPHAKECRANHRRVYTLRVG